jgi:hypothetical protein
MTLQAHLKAPPADAPPKLLKELAFKQQEINKIMSLCIRELIALAITGRYMSLACPHRENLLAKEDR